MGKLVAQRAIEKGVKEVVFDRGGYHLSRPGESAGRRRARSRPELLRKGSWLVATTARGAEIVVVATEKSATAKSSRSSSTSTASRQP